MRFEEQLKVGRVGEGDISRWLQRCRSVSVFPAYEKEMGEGKGPQLFCFDGDLVLPDMLVFGAEKIHWVEAKTKTHFTWWRRTKRWTTGIDTRHYHQYVKVAQKTNIPVWLLFYHKSDTPSASDLAHGSPTFSPTGLYGQNIKLLSTRIDHICPAKDAARDGMLGHGRHGMVYWAENDLRRLATIEDVKRASETHRSHG